MTSGDVGVPVVVVTGANGFVGSRVCRELASRGTRVRAVVRRAGSVPRLGGLEEWVGDFTDPVLAAAVVAGAGAVVSTAHPMRFSSEVQHRVAVEGTPRLARAAREAGVSRLVHVSTAAVYDRSPWVGDVDESARLVGPEAGDYARTKRDTDAALARVDGLTRVLVRSPAVLGPGETSLWNTLRPAAIREEEHQRHVVPGSTFAWVHVDDLAGLLADLATGVIPTASDPAAGPVPGACTALNVGAGHATRRDYLETVTRALGVEPRWDDEPTWTGRLRTERAEGWGWAPRVSLPEALAELDRCVRALAGPAPKPYVTSPMIETSSPAGRAREMESVTSGTGG